SSDLYNERRRHIKKAQPNPGHLLLAEMEKQYDICIITQNIDDLHERAGSSDVIHLHGEIMKSRSSRFEELIYLQTEDIKIGDCCEKGYQLRPHIVWFGEMVP
ncbi:MAG TPA: NAD-dependent protein deacylase, partial [Bacteroidetes bacterium]|nr:NAD-dependent protein deacylase [Bacteroidota bacterium]